MRPLLGISCVIEGALDACILRERPQGDWSLVSGECYFGCFGGDLDVRVFVEDEEENFAIW